MLRVLLDTRSLYRISFRPSMAFQSQIYPNQSIIPVGPIAPANDFRIVEANLSYRLLNHEFSFGKSDHWMGPARRRELRLQQQRGKHLHFSD